MLTQETDIITWAFVNEEYLVCISLSTSLSLYPNFYGLKFRKLISFNFNLFIYICKALYIHRIT